MKHQKVNTLWIEKIIWEGEVLEEEKESEDEEIKKNWKNRRGR